MAAGAPEAGRLSLKKRLAGTGDLTLADQSPSPPKMRPADSR